MKKTNELTLVINETGLNEAVTELLNEKFKPFLEQAAEWKHKAAELVVTDESQVDLMKEARTARLALAKIRTAADAVRKELKEDSLKYGRAVQGVYNVIESAIKPIEEHLYLQEKYKENMEAKRKQELRISRTELVLPYRDYMVQGIDLGEITDTDFERLLASAKVLKQHADEAAAKAEAERIERERLEAEDRERLRIENERLKAEAEKREAEMKAERDRIEAEQRAANIAAAKAKKEADAKAAAARAELERIEAELKAKKDAELQAEADKQAAIEAELSKGDKDKVKDLLNDLQNLKTKYQFRSKKYKTLYFAVCELLEKIIVYINSKN